MTKLRGALIGCGFFARNHLLAWGDIAEVELVAVCDRDPEKAHAAAALTGAKAYTDAAVMFAEVWLDFVDVVTTMESHEALMALAAEHRVPAICQKPFAPDLAAVRRIVARAEKAGTPIMVHENFRFQRPLVELRRLIDTGAIGRPVFAAIDWRTGYDVTAGQPYLAEVERFILLDLGIHLLDVARFILGDAAEVYCRTQHTMSKARGEAQGTILITMESGALCSVFCTYTDSLDPDPFPQTLIEVEGEEGTIRLLHNYRMELHRQDGMRLVPAAPTLPAWADPQWALAQESVLNTQRHWVESLLAGREPQTSGRDNLKTFALLEAAYASAASGQPERPES